MVDKIRNKIRALISDFSKSGIEIFTYTVSSVFTIAQVNIEISGVLKNGTTLAEDKYSFDDLTNKLTVTDTLSEGDVIEVNYTYYKYSSTELDEYLRASLVWLSVYGYNDKDYELESGELIAPTPDNRTTDLMALISSILIKPDYSSYRLPNLTVTYNKKMSKEERIEKLIGRFISGLGVNDVLDFDEI